VDLVALVQRGATDFQQLTESHKIRVRATVSALIGAWDPLQLERVFMNLLSNAVKYSPEGSAISISMGWKRTTTGPVAVVRVADPGIGIPHADLPRILDGFHRSGNALSRATGSGVGLMAVRRIIELHGGTVSVRSTENRGTKVTLHLPLNGGVSALGGSWS
jgi:signal transduction histidine kinase